ncbi:MAG TPA: sialidase family protein [Blastocatellia bacterium]|nr:sialidase family protein [Blastocatellia bacterium]
MVRSSSLALVAAVVLVSAGGPVPTRSVAAQVPGSFGATRAPSIQVDGADRLYLAMSVATSPTGGPHSQIFFTWSVDGGVTWDNLPKTRNLSSSPGEAFGPCLVTKTIERARAYIVYHDNSTGVTQTYFIRSKKKSNFRSPVNITGGFVGAFSPRIAVDSAENLSVVWGDTTGGGRRVIFLRSTDLGITFGSKQVISRSPAAAFDPDIAIDRSDAINVAWQDTALVRSAIMFTRSTDSGRSFSEPRAISLGPGDATEVHLTSDAAGRLHALWVDSSAGDHQIFYSRSTDSGGTWSAPINVSNLAGANCHKPAILVFDDTAYIAYDESERTSQVFLAKSADGGLSFGAPVQISNASPRTGRGHSPAMVRDSTGTLHIVWVDSSVVGNDDGLLYYSNTKDGRTFQPQRLIFAAL